MFVLGLQGSPRLKGNTSILLSAFLGEAKRLGGRTRLLNASRMKVTPCQECGTCEREGFCPLDDDMQEVFYLLREADIVVMATPVFFYGPTAQLKAIIDRTQALWARKYIHKLADPGRNWRRGLVLSVGATKGENLFDGIILTAKYFFDAVGAVYEDNLTYRRVEKAGEISKHPTALDDVKEKATALVTPLVSRKKVLFVCKDNSSLSQMASAFAQLYAGNTMEVHSGGVSPGEALDSLMTEVMSEKGIDMAFRRPMPIEDALANGKPDLVLSVGPAGGAFDFSEVPVIPWDLPDHSGEPVAVMRRIRDDIEKRVKAFVKQETGQEGTAS